MFDRLNSMFGRRPPQKGTPLMRETPAMASPMRNQGDRKQTYSKVFRWRLPDGHTQDPTSVEVVGSFTHWQRTPMTRDGKLDAWHVTLHHIEGNKTHHYMLLVDGNPANDKNCDGFAVPHGHQEEQYAITTDKGPRVFMLFAQAR